MTAKKRVATKKSAAALRRKQERMASPVVPVGVDITWRTKAQKEAWLALPNQQISFLLGAAGSGKTFLAMAFAINEILAGRRQHIVLTRPLVESGEKLGHLPGDVAEKVDPYMKPLYLAMDKLLGKVGPAREIVRKAVVLAPLGYMRGCTFDHSVCIFDEAQNATKAQLKMFLTRFGENSRVVVTGDPAQPDLPISPPPLLDIIGRLDGMRDTGFHIFDENDCVRHPLITEILKRI